MTRLALALALLAGPGCQAVGQYFANRARDLGECVRVQVGGGIGIGGGVHAAGIAELGLGGGVLLPSYGVGWAYGDGYAFGLGSKDLRQGQADYNLYPPFSMMLAGAPALHYESPEWMSDSVLNRGHSCFGLLPCCFNGPMLKRAPFHRANLGPKGQIHNWDVEVSAYAGVVGVRVGVSPGEILDFLLGWFGIDIAGDDVPRAITFTPSSGMTGGPSGPPGIGGTGGG